MANKRDITNEFAFLINLHGLVDAYEEIAAMRMRKMRSSVLTTRAFMAGVEEVFQEVKLSYRNELLGLMRKKKIKDVSRLSVIKRNGKTAAVLLSANTGLYGDIVRKTFTTFASYVSKQNCEIAIVGRLGRNLFQAVFPTRKFQYFAMPDGHVDAQIVTQIATFLIAFEKIFVFYGQFENIAMQKPTMLDVYGSAVQNQASEEQVVGGDKNVVTSKYFFEPSLEDIVRFFESELFASIFEQATYESHLAKFASRMFNLDLATENIGKRLRAVELGIRRIKHRTENSKQLSSLSGMSLWGTV